MTRPDPDVAVASFLTQLPELFHRGQAREEWLYNGIIHRLADREASPGDLERIEAFHEGVGTVTHLAEGKNLERLNVVLRDTRYPDPELLTRLDDVEGLTLPLATTVLHFFHPAFPPGDPRSARSLRDLGYAVDLPQELTASTLERYRGYVAAVDDLKRRLRPQHVPASNLWLSRVLQVALSEWRGDREGQRG